MKTFKWTVPENGIGPSSKESKEKKLRRWKRIEKKGRLLYTAELIFISIVGFCLSYAVSGYDDSYIKPMTKGLFMGIAISQISWMSMKKKYSNNKGTVEP